MKPLSALYYIKENRMRSLIVIFMFMFTTLLYMAGNYVDSVYYYWDRYMEYTDKMLLVNGLSTDEDYEDFNSFYEDLLADDMLTVMPRTPQGSTGLSWTCTMGFDMGSASMVFETPEDLKTAFEAFGIDADLSDVSDGTVCISSALAAQYGLKKGDEISSAQIPGFVGRYPIAAILDDNSYIVFYVRSGEYEGSPVRLNVLGNGISGMELYDHLTEIKGDRKVDISEPSREAIHKQFEPFNLIFGVGIVILTLILAMIVGSVLSGQFMARRYEFGVFRAIGLSRGEVYFKIFRELAAMDMIAVAAGGALVFISSFLLNELYYIPDGKYLPYYSKTGLYAFLASNLLVLIPMFLLKGREMAKCDVTEF